MKLSSLSLVKYALAAVLTLLFGTAYSQYPATGNKARLGWQTTGDGLVYRGVIADTSTLDPSGLNNAWMLLDTVNGSLYAYRSKAWQLVSGGGGVSMPFDSVTFNINEGDASEQELKYSAEKGYLQYGGLDSVQIPLLPGIWYVRNDTSVTIPKGTVVRASGTLGASGRIKVKHMIADGSIPAMYILGIAMHDIASGADGYVMTQGKIRQLNTEAYSEGAVLYADVDTLGGLTQTEPGNGFLKLPIAFVVHSASNGILAVRVTSGAYMRDLHDVEVTSPDSSASLYYNTAQGIWRDTTGAVLTSDTSVFARDFQISGTADQVAYFNAANAVTSDTAFRWSAANKTLGINTSTTSGANIIIKNSQEPSRSTVVATQTFSADTTNWTRGTGWTFNGTAAVATAATGNLTYTPALTITSGNAYEVTYTISGYSAGTLTVAVGNATYSLPRYNVTSNVVVLFPTSASGGFRFTTSTFTGNVDNVSVVQIANQAPVLFAGQDDNASTLYNSLRMPNSTTLAFSGGGGYSTGLNNNFLGALTGQGTTTGAGNNFFGSNAGRLNTTGSNNNFFGTLAGDRNTTGSNNNFFGTSAGQISTTGSNNNFFGNQAGASLIIGNTGSNNNFLGSFAGASNTTGSDNNFFGNRAGNSNTSGVDNNFFGSGAGLRNTTGANNVFIGNEAGYNNSTGNANIFIGLLAGQTNTTGNGNTFLGDQAGTSNTTASNNVFMGTFSGQNTTTGGSNFFLGNQSGRYNVNGTSNFLLGDGAGLWHRSGASNIFIGTNTGPQTAADTLSGSNNIIIGRNAADNIRAAATANVAIGNQVDLPTNNGSNQGVYQNVLFFTGASGTGTTIAAGSRAGIKTNAPASDFHVAGEVRIDDLKPTGTPRNIVGSSSTGDLSTMAWGNGLTVSVGDTTLRVDTSVILPKVNVSGTTNYLAKFTGSNAVGNSQVFDDGTNVGIGDATPSYKLDVNGTAYATTVITNGNFVGNGQLTTADARSGLVSIGPSSNTVPQYFMGGYGTFYGAGHTTKAGNVEFGVGQNTTGKIIFYTDNFAQNQTMTLTNNSFVGINTASPSRALHVEGEARISDLTTDTPTRIVGADADGDLGEITLGTGLSITSGTLNASGIASVYIPINLFAIGDTVTNTTTAKDFFLVHSGLNGYCIDSYTVKAIAGAGSADIQLDKNGTGGNLQAISGTTVYTKDTNIALVTGDYIRGQVFNLSGTLVGLGLTLEIKATCN